MTQWNQNPSSHLSGLAETATLLIAGPKQRIDIWYASLSADERFRVTTFATDPQDLRAKMSSNPDIILVDATIFDGPTPLIETLTRIEAAIYVVLPQLSVDETESLKQALECIPNVKGIYVVDVNLAALVEKMSAEMRARRFNDPGLGWVPSAAGGSKPVSTRVVAVWNQMGGVGKTTVSSNLSYLAAQRGYPTLLVGLGAPDDLPLIMDLKAQPNITNWQAKPTPDGLRLAIQKLDTLDVIGGFPDTLSEAQAMEKPMDDPASVKNLVDTAIREGYAVIVIDAPPTSLAAMAMAAANTLVMVARPSLEAAYRTVDAYRMVAERLDGLHNISRQNIYVVLNRMQAGHRVDADSWHHMASEQIGGFPPVVAQIPDLVSVGDTQDGRLLPVQRVDAFRQALKPLADTLFSSDGRPLPSTGREKRIFGVKVRF